MTAPEIDPTQRASERFNRRVFVGISAAAAVAAPACVLGEPGQLAQLAPVSDDDPAISVELVKLRRPDVVIPAYAAWPIAATHATPTVVVIMHAWGVDASIREVVRRFAKAGFAAIAPNLYARLDAPSGDGATDFTIFRPYLKRLDRTQYDGDAAAAAAWLAARFPGGKTGIVGFCMGGRIALLAASDDAAFSAVCPFYGPIADVDPQAIQVPVCGSYGARDQSIPAAAVRAFADALHVPNDFRIYDTAGHAFFDDRRPSYDASAAADAWARTTLFLEKYLRA